MAGGRAYRRRRAGYVAGLAVMFLALGATARAQIPERASPAPAGDAQLQDPAPPAGMPAASFADIVDSVDPPEAMPGLPSFPRPWHNSGPGTAPVVVRLEGTNVELGKKMLADSGLNIVTADGMIEAAKKVVAAAK